MVADVAVAVRALPQVYAGLVQQMVKHPPQSILVELLFNQFDETGNGVVPQP